MHWRIVSFPLPGGAWELDNFVSHKPDFRFGGSKEAADAVAAVNRTRATINRRMRLLS
jgi:hypothetical protein